RILPLWVTHGGEQLLVGGLLLGQARGTPALPPAEALQVMGERLSEMLQAEVREHAVTVS
ncbi:MAG TPA: hypothetical protein VFZ61_27100, partial [Polyangiales bacterium]